MSHVALITKYFTRDVCAKGWAAMNYGAWGLEQGEVANIFDPVSEHMETSAVYPRDALPLGTQIPP